jgi:nucleotide-binding universal stress UspA family protein
MKNTVTQLSIEPDRLSSLAAVMVPLDLGTDSESRVKCAASIADRFGSRLIGIGAREPMLAIPQDGREIDARLVDLEQEQIAADLIKGEAVFRRVAGTRTDVEWRSEVGAPLVFASEQARAADLLVVSRRAERDQFEPVMGVDPADLVFVTGRPILVVPPQLDYVFTRRIVVAWKDAREARRAVVDSLPILKTAKEVLVLSVEGEDRGAKDVCAFLSRHGVESSALCRSSGSRNVAETILQIVGDEAADLIVSGGYGHGRMREWIFGGVTRDLLQGTTVPWLLSH